MQFNIILFLIFCCFAAFFVDYLFKIRFKEQKMNIVTRILSIACTFFFTTLIWAASDGSVKISEPKDKAQVSAKTKIMIMYEADTGAKGDHIHLMVNDKREALLRQMKGHTEVGPLKAGNHKICLVINTKSHVPTGAEACVNVTAK
jgi:hypothetical protein